MSIKKILESKLKEYRYYSDSPEDNPNEIFYEKFKDYLERKFFNDASFDFDAEEIIIRFRNKGLDKDGDYYENLVNDAIQSFTSVPSDYSGTTIYDRINISVSDIYFDSYDDENDGSSDCIVKVSIDYR